MTEKEAIIELRKIARYEDKKTAHEEADLIICEVLETLRMLDLVEHYKKVR